MAMLYKFEARAGDFIAITDVEDGANLPLESGPWRPAGILDARRPDTEEIVQSVAEQGYIVLDTMSV